MSRTLRNRRVAYDNIAVGAAISSNENTIAGETASVFEVYGGGTQTSTSTGDQNITNGTVGSSVSETGMTPDRVVDAAGATTAPTDENVGVGG